MIFFILFAATSFSFAANAKINDKIEKISPFFEPPPLSLLNLDQTDLKHHTSKNPNDLFGEIKMTPPSGTCFRVEKNRLARDQKICEKKFWRYTVADLSLDGDLALKIWLPNEQFPVNATWRSIYRKGKIREYDDQSKNASLVIVSECSVSEIEGRRRLVQVTFLGKNPALNFILPPRGEDIVVKRKVLDLMANGDELTELKGKAKKENQLFWDIKGEIVHTLPGDQVMTRIAATPGLRGICRYNYTGHGPNSEHGLIECHETNNYKYLKIPLTCLNKGEAS